MKTTEQIMELAEDYADFAADHAHECSTPNELALLLNGRAALQAAIEALVQERDEFKTRMQRLMTTQLATNKERDALKAEVKTLRDALETIQMWQSHTSKYSIDYGSNGVRELYRDIARQALTRSKS